MGPAWVDKRYTNASSLVGATTLNIMTLSIMTLSIIGLFLTFSINYNQHNNNLLSVAFHL